jgi:hypothetical protein
VACDRFEQFLSTREIAVDSHRAETEIVGKPSHTELVRRLPIDQTQSGIQNLAP